MSKNEATLAGGCFWGVEELFRNLPGVLDTQVGYTGGSTSHPTYQDICTGLTGHAEALRIIYDPSLISYKDILHFFFKIHDPTTINQQGNDKGSQYRSAIFYHSDEQRHQAEEVIAEVEELKRYPGKVVTQIRPFSQFWEAEEEHQDYLKKYPGGYNCHYIRD